MFGFRTKGVLAMTRKLFSLAGVLIAVFSFTVGGADVEARHCRGQRNRCCQQNANYGNSNGSCCQQNGNNGYQQNANYGYRNNGNQSYQQTSNYGPGQVTYGTSAAAIDAGQPAPAVQVTAPVPTN